MAQRRKTPAEMFRIQQEAEQLRKRQKSAQKRKTTLRNKKTEAVKTAVSKFKPGKRDAGKWVFIGEKGKAIRKPTARSKGVFAYVTKTGKVQKFKATGQKSSAFRSFGGYRLAPKKGKKSFARFFAQRMVKASGIIRSDKNKEVTYRQILNGVRKMIPDSKGAKQIVIEATVYFVTPDKRVHSVTVIISQGAKQILSRKDLARIVRANLWGAISAQLRLQGYVSKASYTVVAKVNKGEPKGEWTYNGQFWGKENLEKVRVVRIEYQSSEAKIRSGK